LSIREQKTRRQYDDKNKALMGLGFLFLIIFALAAFCSNHVGKLAQETDNILKDNYNSLVYSRNMISALEDMKNMGIAFDTNTRDEAFVILQAINLIENKLGVKTEDTDSR